MSIPTAGIFLSTLLLVTTAQSLAAPACHAIFTADSHSSKAIETTIEQLASYRVKLDTARAEGHSSAAISAMEADYRAKEIQLVEYIKKSQLMTNAELVEKIKAAIKSHQNAQSKTKTEKKTKEEEQRRDIENFQIDGSRAIFHRIEPGSFNMVVRDVDPFKSTLKAIAMRTVSIHPVTITKPFEMMATPVTQLIWKKVAELANSKTLINPNPGIIPLPVDPSLNKGPVLPVESLSPINIEQWLQRLNELSAEGNPDLSIIIAGHMAGDRYRLPTEAEWEFVATNRGQRSMEQLFADPQLVADYAWFKLNSLDTTHEVALKKPLITDDREFFDMLGNVSELTADTYQENLKPVRGGVDPHHFDARFVSIGKGGNFLESQERLNSPTYDIWEHDVRSSALGFRLVREVRNQNQ